MDADAYLLELVRYLHLNPVRAGLEEGYRVEFHGGGADARVLGDEDFLAQVVEAPRRSRPPELETIVRHVRARYGTREEELASPSRVRRLAKARGVVGWLAMRTGAASLTEIARRFHRDVATLSQSVCRLDLVAKQEPAVARELSACMDEIMQ